MKTFTDFLEQQIASEQEYTRLQKLIMTALICFNKRRPAEVANLTLADYRLSLHNTEDREEIMKRLSPEERTGHIKTVRISHFMGSFLDIKVLCQIFLTGM